MLPEWKTLNCKWSSPLKHPLVCTMKFYYESKSSSKWAGIFTSLSVNITAPQKQSFQTLQVRGSWESRVLILYPSNSSLSPTTFFKSCLVHQKNIETLRGPEEGGESNTKRTNFGNKCFKASIFHIDYDFEVHLIIFCHSHFS